MSNFVCFENNLRFFTDLRRKISGRYAAFEGISDSVYSFIYGCFESMDFCVSHNLFISSLTSFTSAYRRFLWHSCALLFGSDCSRFFQVQHCIPEVRNSQCHRQNRIKFGGLGKRICFSCRRLSLSAPVCTANHHLDIFSTRFCVLCLPFFVSFLK